MPKVVSKGVCYMYELIRKWCLPFECRLLIPFKRDIKQNFMGQSFGEIWYDILEIVLM